MSELEMHNAVMTNNAEILQWVKMVKVLTDAISDIGKIIDKALHEAREVMPK